MKDVWFANQVPEYACASIAILNLVNNIPGLDLGKELRDFKDFTQDMDPLMRGDTIDSFDFVKRIHNSFARENDMLNADKLTQDKVQKAKKVLSTQKARETREAKKAERESLAEFSANVTKPAANASNGKLRRPTARQAAVSANTSAPARKGVTTVASDPSETSEGSDNGYDPKGKAKAREVVESSAPPRRSGRAPKPRKVVTSADYEESEPGYHYVAYVPIGNHVWKLDGMDRYPQDLGSFDKEDDGAGGGVGRWLDVVTPMIQDRMSQNSGNIDFCLMAVVRDPYFDELKQLLVNIKTLQAVDDKLDNLNAEWRSMEGGETRKDVVTGISIEFEITQKDIHDAELPQSAEDAISSEDDFLKLMEYRKGVLEKQTSLRSGVRDARKIPKEEEEDARLRKHDYGPFVRGWLSALADEGVLQDLLG